MARVRSMADLVSNPNVCFFCVVDIRYTDTDGQDLLCSTSLSFKATVFVSRNRAGNRYTYPSRTLVHSVKVYTRIVLPLLAQTLCLTVRWQ